MLALLRELWFFLPIGEKQSAKVLPGSWRLKPPECSEVLIFTVGARHLCFHRLVMAVYSEIPILLYPGTILSKKA